MVRRTEKRGPELSIIIITLNEQKHILRLLKSIKKQRYKNFEIILSDAGSKDKTIEIARGELKKELRVVKGGLPARGRNEGAKHSKGKILLFLDADVILPSGFLEKIMQEFKKEKADVATVSLVPLTRDKTEKFFHKSYNLWQKIMSKISPHSAGSCIIIKKSLFNRLRGFDETIKLGEDHALARKAFKSGAKYKILDTKIFVSTRRIGKEGKTKFIVKHILAALHRATIGEVRSDIFKYDMKR